MFGRGTGGAHPARGGRRPGRGRAPPGPAPPRHHDAPGWPGAGARPTTSAGVDVVLLDLGLPDIDGVDVCRAIREVSEVPVIVVSARGEVDDRILGLHSGADDYLVKPYDIGELLARVHAVYRRASPRPGLARPATSWWSPTSRSTWSATRSRWRAGPSPSPARSSRCSGCSRRRGGRCARAAGSSPRCGAAPGPGANRTLDVHVATLRTKLGRPELVQTVRGVGYRLGLPD